MVSLCLGLVIIGRTVIQGGNAQFHFLQIAHLKAELTGASGVKFLGHGLELCPGCLHLGQEVAQVVTFGHFLALGVEGQGLACQGHKQTVVVGRTGAVGIVVPFGQCVVGAYVERIVGIFLCQLKVLGKQGVLCQTAIFVRIISEQVQAVNAQQQGGIGLSVLFVEHGHAFEHATFVGIGHQIRRHVGFQQHMQHIVGKQAAVFSGLHQGEPGGNGHAYQV
ncbi:unknown [Prevotella sp. CAG:891]|nr:unknown [Prevotella sp. CAG:891]